METEYNIFDENTLVKKTKKTSDFIRYVNNNIEKVISDPIKVTASKIKGSSSTVNRIIKILGFKKYAEFKLHLSNYLSLNKLVENEKRNHDKEDICCVNKKIQRQIQWDLNNSFSPKVLDSIKKLGNHIWKNKNLIILYNMKGTFLASLLRHEMNAMGITSVVSKTEIDFQSITKNTIDNLRRICIIFSDMPLQQKTKYVLKEYKYKVLVTRKIDLNFDSFNKKINLIHKSSENYSQFDVSKYILHTVFASNLISWLHIKKKEGKNEK